MRSTCIGRRVRQTYDLTELGTKACVAGHRKEKRRNANPQAPPKLIRKATIPVRVEEEIDLKLRKYAEFTDATPAFVAVAEGDDPATHPVSTRNNGARGGSRTHMRKNPRRILSPQRLPFRHPGNGI
jgi:hypothetical protein